MISIRRHSVRLGFLLSGALSFSGVQAEPPANLKSEAASNLQHDGRHDFDFEVGTWNAHVKNLAHRLSHSTDWEEFSGTAVTRTLPMFEGWNESELQAVSPTSGKHMVLLGVRLYNDATHAHLEQAFSDDGGKTWETNWIYDGERKSK